MRKWTRYAPAIGGFGIGLVMWLLEVAEVDIPTLWLIVLGCIAVVMVIYGVSPVVVSTFGKIRRLRIYVVSDAQQKSIKDNALEFSVKLESLSTRSSGIWFDRPLETQEPIRWLVAKVSFRTNQVVQIASIHLEIDPVDPRDIVEPDLDLVQGFSLPHILYRSETHQFQFRLSPGQAENEHNLLLKVLAGGNWYTDGPYEIGTD